MTLLRRLGNKSKIAKDVQSHFPHHKQYIEMFFGAGGIFFNKPKAKYNIVNDNDSQYHPSTQSYTNSPRVYSAIPEPLDEPYWLL